MNQDNLAFLAGRSPVIVPSGILPETFQPIEGSVYDSFAHGLPPVIFINGEFLPLTDEEVNYLKSLYSQMASASSGGGPESIPQMPTIPTSPEYIENFDAAANFERNIESKQEKPQEDESSEDNNSQQPSQIPTDAQVTTSEPEILVDARKVFDQGRNLVSQQTLDEIYQDYKKGKLKPPTNAGTDSNDWMKWLLLKVFRSYYD